MTGNLGRRTAASAVALAATAVLVAGCGDDTGEPDAAPTNESTEQTAPEPTCAAKGFDLDTAETVIDDGHKDIVVNADGFLFVQDETSPGVAYLLRAGNLLEQISVEGLPGQENADGVFEVEPAPGGFVVETKGATEDALSTEEPTEMLTYVTDDGEVAWSSEIASDIGWTVRGHWLIEGILDFGDNASERQEEKWRAAWRFFDVTTGEPGEDPLPGPEWYLVDSLISGSPVAFSNGDQHLDADGKPLTEISDDALVSDEWVLTTKDTTRQGGTVASAMLRGHHLDGGSQWQREVKADASGISVCGQYVYVAAEDGIHVLDQNADGQEVAVIPTPEKVTFADEYQPKGFLIYTADGDHFSSMPD